MIGFRVLAAAVFILGLAAAPTLAGCTPEAQEPSRLQVMTSTSLLTYIVERVGGDLLDVASIVAPSQHPGDFDATPGDIRKLADADLFLLHGWPGETFAPGLIEAADNPDLKVVTIQVDGNWMTPAVQLAAAELVVEALIQEDSANEDSYRRGADEYKSAVTVKDAEIQSRLREAGVGTAPVLGSFWQAGFVRWVGLSIIATYGPAELTLQGTRKLVDQGREAGVVLVIDNLHSGRDAGKAIAEELGCARVILSNFPGAFDNTGTWEKAVEWNIDLILEALDR